MRSSLLASVNVIEFQTEDAYSSLDLTNVVYNLSIHSRDEKFNLIIIKILIIITIIIIQDRIFFDPVEGRDMFLRNIR
jgi:hypothetical protein